MNRTTTFVLSLLAISAFALNSIFCRLALKSTAIDPILFTCIRLVAGAVFMALIVAIRDRKNVWTSGSWRGGIAVFSYAIFFSIAYLELDAGMGALLLFGSVQLTMLSIGYVRGDRLSALQWLGFWIAVMGLVLLMWPTATGGSINESTLVPRGWAMILMLISGASWGLYSLMAKGTGEPTAVTAGNLIRSGILVAAVGAIAGSRLNWDSDGACWALLSGTLTTGIGYAIWYQALKGLSASIAASVQLTVPVIVNVAGWAFMGELIGWRQIWSSIGILGGVGIVIWFGRSKKNVNDKQKDSPN
ncbi:MAG: DMT family transporter [Pirellulaceae bacterium]